MSVGSTEEEGSASSESAEPVVEGDVPKPAFELPPDDDKDEGESTTATTTTPVPGRQTREQRRRESREGYAQTAQRYREEARSEREERMKIAQQLAELKGRFEASREQARPAADGRQTALDSVALKIEQSLERMAGGDVAAKADWVAARREEARLQARFEREDAESARPAPREADPVLSAVAAKYDWITHDDDARRVAEGIVAKLVKREGRDMSDPKVRRATLFQACAETERELEMPTAGSAPTDAQKARYQGVGGQPTGAGRSARPMVALSGDQKAQAEALFRHLEPDAAHREWWKKIGSTIANK